jgi:parallel beta-helix repeat protein
MRRCLRGIGFVGISFALAGVLSHRSADAQIRPKAKHMYFVAPTGSDANPGTDALPFRTLARGVRVLTPGDTLYIKSGTYPEALLDSIPSGTSWDSPVTVAAAPGQLVTLKPPAGTGFVLHFQGPQQYITIDGLVLDATNVTYDAVKITSGGGRGPAYHIRLIRCEIKHAPGQGVLVSGSADWNEFIALNVHDNGSNKWDHGFYISTSHNVVEGSIIHHNTGYGVHVYSEDAKRRADRNMIRSNRIYSNGFHGGAGIILGSGDGNTAYNNLVWGNAAGIKVASATPSNTAVYNNTVYSNTHYGIYVEGHSRKTIIKNNLLYANGLPEIQNAGIGTVIDRNLTGTDPKFVNATSGDFRLQPGSPAIDAGARVEVVTQDRDGTRRPQGLRYDIGAFESAAPSP